MPVEINAAVLTISDSRKVETDTSGAKLAELLADAGANVTERLIVSDDLADIRETIYTLTERDDINLILTSGGTGFGPRDNTPEATRAVIDREAPGIAEAMRRETSRNTPLAMLSRGIAGIRNGTLIINLPGSPKAVAECFEVIKPVLSHSVDLISGKTTH